MDVARWLAGDPPGPITPDQLAEWEAFAEVEPWGSAQDDLRFGTVAAAVHNNRGFVKPPESAHQPSTYFPRIKPAWKPPSKADLAAKLIGFFGKPPGK